MQTPILVPIYIGHDSVAVVQRSVRLAKEFGASLEFVFPLDATLKHYLGLTGYPTCGPLAQPSRVQTTAQTLAQQTLELAVATAQNAGVEANGTVVEASPLEAIQQTALDHELVVVGRGVFPWLDQNQVERLAQEFSQTRQTLLLTLQAPSRGAA